TKDERRRTKPALVIGPSSFVSVERSYAGDLTTTQLRAALARRYDLVRRRLGAVHRAAGLRLRSHRVGAGDGGHVHRADAAAPADGLSRRRVRRPVGPAADDGRG